MNDTNINPNTSKNGWKVTTFVFIGLTVALVAVSAYLLVKLSAANSNDITNNTQTSDTSKDTTTNKDKDELTTVTTPDVSEETDNDGYLVIGEWGVKIKMRDAAVMSYVFTDYSNELPDFRGIATFDSSVRPVISSDDPNCLIGMDILRLRTLNNDAIAESFSPLVRNVGDRKYLRNGPQQTAFCADSDLGRRVTDDLTTLDMVAL
jgi:hypothetical protein